MTTAKTKKELSLPMALLPIVCLIVFMIIAVSNWGAGPHVPLLFGSVIAGIVGVAHGYRWTDIEEHFMKVINTATLAMVILMLMGALVGMWVKSGTVPAMVYYGLKILKPSIFPFTSCLLCGIVAIATGSSWTTAATVGVALMGIGSGLGISPALTAGTIISGAYFGDRLSPLSDFTNLASGITGVNLFDHIRHMLYTSIPAYVLALIIYFIIGLRYSSDSVDTQLVDEISQSILDNFNVNPLLLIPPIFVVCMVFLKIPTIPGMMLATGVGMLFYILFQRDASETAIDTFGTIISSLNDGVEMETGNEIVDNLVNRGGIQAMMWTVSLVFCAMTFGGILEAIGAMEAITKKLLKLVRGNGSLVAVTIISSIFTNAVTGDVYLSMIIPGKMYKDEYRKRRLATENLSRALEDGGCVSSCLFPWNSCGAYMTATLGVNSFAFLPFAFANLLTPIISIIFATIGFSMTKMSDEEKRKIEEEEGDQIEFYDEKK